MFEYSDVDASTEKCEAAKTGAERYLGYVTLSDNQWFYRVAFCSPRTNSGENYRKPQGGSVTVATISGLVAAVAAVSGRSRGDRGRSRGLAAAVSGHSRGDRGRNGGLVAAVSRGSRLVGRRREGKGYRRHLCRQDNHKGENINVGRKEGTWCQKRSCVKRGCSDR